ncbi:hypothetical protein [Microbacterium kribbense]|uniref:hypothetical protein n=1 Tax=Microbacterium kribbense TaxID=433645 RepID=UPI0031DA0B87
MLAEQFGVAKSTILRILREGHVVVRRQPMTPEQVSDAAQLYEAGLSLSQVLTGAVSTLLRHSCAPQAHASPQRRRLR